MRVALIQQKYPGDKKKMIAATSTMVSEASKNRAELVILQELHQGEYFCQSEDTKFFDYAADYEADLSYWSAVAK
jgi:N-carbamoylputrescine amidase